MNRRDLLKTVGLTATAALSGCNTGSDTPTANQDATATSTETQTVTDSSTPTDTTSPVIDEFSAHPTDTGGDVETYLEGHDDESLASAAVTTPRDRIDRDPDGATVTVDTAMQGRPGLMNDVTARLTDDAGNTTEETVDAYVRTFDPLADPAIDFAAVYIPFVGTKWGKCMPYSAAEPAIGHYEVGDDRAYNWQIDRMQGHGITTLAYNYNGVDSQDGQFHQLVDAKLVSDIGIEPYYVVGHALKWSDDTPAALRGDMEFMHQHVLTQENARTIDGRPVVQFWGTRTLSYVEWAGMDKGDDPFAVAHEWESAADFLDELRTRLTVDGHEPYLIGEFRNHGVGEVPDVVDEDAIDWLGQFTMSDGLQRVAREMDAVSNWTGLLYKGQTTPWDVGYEVAQMNFEGLRQFADDHGIDFIPTVYPGFNDTHNSCWGAGRHKPRSTAHLRQMIDLADRYRTRDRVNVATWNGWPEGHQLEPGTFQGTDYGTDYVEVVEQFQRGEAG